MKPNGRPGAPLLEVDHLEVKLPVRNTAFGRLAGHVSAVDDVTFSLGEGETLGVVGESGCGKTTLIRAIARLRTPTGGSISFRGEDITTRSQRGLSRYRREAQMVFQDSQTSLNPRRQVGDIVYAAAKLRDKSRRDVGDLFERLGLARSDVNRYPREFSGGQRQRIGIARALAADPSLLLLDEPVSALDVSIQAQIINLLQDLQVERRLSYILVAHDLQVVRHISRRILVVYLGKAVEQATADELYRRPMHPYTAALIDAVPVPDPTRRRSRQRITGELPSPLDPPTGCRFHTRCPRATEVCRAEEPPLAAFPGGHTVACHHPLNVSADEMATATRASESPNSTPPRLSLSPVASATA
jgi:oligopeptide/dipeptide ABC transporter ATP-binding protein